MDVLLVGTELLRTPSNDITSIGVERRRQDRNHEIDLDARGAIAGRVGVVIHSDNRGALSVRGRVRESACVCVTKTTMTQTRRD